MGWNSTFLIWFSGEFSAAYFLTQFQGKENKQEKNTDDLNEGQKGYIFSQIIQASHLLRTQ